MLTVRLAATLMIAMSVLFASAGTAAWADSSVTADGQWVTGRSQETRARKVKQDSPASTPSSQQKSAQQRYYKPSETPVLHAPESGCLTDVGASPALRCAVEDKPAPPRGERAFVPPSEAEVRVALRLPDPTPRFGPDPEVNEWKMLVVGYPVWLWTDAPTRLSATARHDGLAMTLRAQWTSTRFDMGDGHSRTCTATTVYPKRPDRYGMPSPTCGYTYQKRSKPGRDYTVTATTHWRVSWSTGGHSGTLMTSYAGQRSLPIGELQALIKG